MTEYKVSLKELYGTQGGELECIVADRVYDDPDMAMKWRRPAVLVVPGGGYAMVSRREAEPVATAFLAKGFQVFILTYLCCLQDAAYPEQLTEIAASVDYIRKNADKLHVNKDEIFAVGFSAGGHLTCDLAVEYASVKEKTGLDLDCRPTAVGLAYPVINGDYGHTGSYDNLLIGYTDEAKEEMKKTVYLDKLVTKETPPAFLWSTAEDTCVPPANSLMYALALAKNEVPFEIHVYPQGVHGASSCDFEINNPSDFLRKNGHWVDDCAAFFRLFTAEKF